MRLKILFIVLISTFLFQNDLLAEQAPPLETSATAAREDAGKSEEMLFFEEEYQVMIATKRLQSVQKAPATVTVVTEEEIRNMGARDLLDILRRVPGFGTTIGYYGRFEFEVRGIKNQGTTGVLLLIDGVPMNDLLNGGPSMPFFHMAIDNIKRI
ncbi:MAG TPA: Plug domain-containing protein, partial [Candidatus Manganitrophaceae bacterium]|nr:Plug domain-containing protein [Candidatus Manganitrophaceae bacterium]